MTRSDTHPQRDDFSAKTAPQTSDRWLRTLLLHGLGVVLVQAVGQATVFILPVLAKREFGASSWQSLLITAPPTMLFVLSIFWGGIFARIGFARSLALYFLVACLPIALIAPATHFWWLLPPTSSRARAAQPGPSSAAACSRASIARTAKAGRMAACGAQACSAARRLDGL
jgi:hypothetical protein